MADDKARKLKDAFLYKTVKELMKKDTPYDAAVARAHALWKKKEKGFMSLSPRAAKETKEKYPEKKLKKEIKKDKGSLGSNINKNIKKRREAEKRAAEAAKG